MLGGRVVDEGGWLACGLGRSGRGFWEERMLGMRGVGGRGGIGGGRHVGRASGRGGGGGGGASGGVVHDSAVYVEVITVLLHFRLSDDETN